MSAAENKAIFLSYASQDAEAARRICETLRAAGVEVWFDAEGGLEHGDEWDAKIRKQIKECVLFIPIISKNTQARLEGYFRLEWELAAQRAMSIASGVAFILPVVIDDTREPEALVPDRFRAVQWTRLPGGVVTPEVKARYLKLWSHRTGISGAQTSPSATPADAGGTQPSPEATAGKPPALPGKRRWLVPAILGVTGAAAAIALWSFLPNSKPKTQNSKPGETAVVAPVSEAQRLLAQARQVYEGGDEINRENLFLAEELVQRALTLDPVEPDAWELGARLTGMMVWHAIDESAARREKLLQQANRAVALAPDSVAARLVLAEARLNLIGILGAGSAPPSQVAEIERELIALAAREPRNWRVQRALGIACRFSNRTDEALLHLQRAVELSGEHPMAIGDLVNAFIRHQRYAEAEPILARALARQRTGRLLTFDLLLKCRWRGDTAGALKAVESWPNWLLKEDRGIAVAWQAAHGGRQAAVALRLLQQYPRDYSRDTYFSGPSAVLSARAHELAGNSAAAQADWRAVVQRCDRDLLTNAQDVVALHWKAWALARLGSLPEAQAAATLLRQRLQSVESSFFRSHTVALLWATVGWSDVALVELEAQVSAPGAAYFLTRAFLQLEPAFDRLRADPRFGELMKRLPAPAPETAAQPPLDFMDAKSKSIAVLPFVNLGADKGDEYLGDGLTEELLSALSQIKGLRVPGRSSCFAFKGKTGDDLYRQIGEKLQVRTVLEGTVRKVGEKIRITAQLINVADASTLWSKPYDGDMKDILTVQTEVAQRVVEALQLQLGVSEVRALAKKPTENPEAHRLYLLGRHHSSRMRVSDWDTAIGYFQRALELDPKFAAAYSGWADASAKPNTHRRGREMWAKKRELAEKALSLDPTLAEAHVSLGTALCDTFDWRTGTKSIDRAIELNPNLALAYDSKAWSEVCHGRFDDAIAAAHKAVALDPLNPNLNYNLGLWLHYARRYDEAKQQLAKTLELNPDSPWATGTLGSCAMWQGDVPTAIVFLEKASALEPQMGNTSWLIYAHAVSGDRTKAEAVMKEFESRPRNGYLSPAVRAHLHLGLGEDEKALDLLEKCYENQDWFCWYFKVRQTYDRVRSHPRFQALLKKTGLDQ